MSVPHWMPTQFSPLEEFRTDRRAKRSDRLRTRPPRPNRRPQRDYPSDPTVPVEQHARYFKPKPLGAIDYVLPLPPDLTMLRPLAHACHERTNLLHPREIPRYADALLALTSHWRDWLRPLDDWEPPEAEPALQFSSLVRHLLALHDVPRFLDAAWHEGATFEGLRQQSWFIHLGSGKSIRDAPDLPLALSRPMTHHFLHTPSGFDVLSAFRRAWVLSLGGSEELSQAILATRLRTDFTEADFWETVVRWLVEHPQVQPVQCGKVIEYLYHQKFVPAVAVPFVPGHPRFVPEQPNLCMKGRTPECLLRSVAEWRLKLLQPRAPASSWKPSGFPPIRVTMPDAMGMMRTYAITELISTAELEEEGKKLGHCVNGYAGVCRSGASSIWSLAILDSCDRADRVLTLQVSNDRREIIQARGRFNRLIEPHEVPIVTQWASAGGPGFAVKLV
jgi:hypothetical protein